MTSPYDLAAPEAVPCLSSLHSEDAELLLALFSCLSTDHGISLKPLLRGSAPRRRWTAQGEIEEVDAACAGVSPELCSLLSDMTRLSTSLQELCLSAAVSKESDSKSKSESAKSKSESAIYFLDGDVASRVRASFSAEQLSFWRCQALVVTYRGIPWTYIEPSMPDTGLSLPHLKYALQAFEFDFQDLSASCKTDLALTLVEASRFPDMSWKRTAISQAAIAAQGLDDWYLHACITRSQCLLSRISGNLDQAVRMLGELGEEETMDPKMNSALGHAAIQRALNCIQVEDLSTARSTLEGWEPFGQEPSLIEQVVAFRVEMILGRVLRFQGAFEKSLAHLNQARSMSTQHKRLSFEGDIRDLVCDLADTLRELDDPTSAEDHLRAEIARQDQKGILSGRSLLELSLAEALFAQERFEEAARTCLDVWSRSGLLKLEKLRLQITMAKMRHVEGDYENAFTWWSGALRESRKFHLTSGRTTRLILVSVCDALNALGQTHLLRAYRNELGSLDENAKPDGTQYWLAGMRHWHGYLES